MGEPYRVPLYARSGASSPKHGKQQGLLGYWYLRKYGSATYKITFRYPGQKHKRYEADTPEQAVSYFYDAYTDHLRRRLTPILSQLARLPKREYHRRGFRKGWLPRLRNDLETKKADLIRESREELVTKLAELKERGWPIPKLPPAPWDRVDASKAASALWLRSANSGSLSQKGVVDQPHSSGASDHVLERKEGAQERGSSDSSAQESRRVGTSLVQAFLRGERKAEEPASSWPFTLGVSQGIRDFARTRTADREGDRGADRARDPEAAAPGAEERGRGAAAESDQPAGRGPIPPLRSVERDVASGPPDEGDGEEARPEGELGGSSDHDAST